MLDFENGCAPSRSRDVAKYGDPPVNANRPDGDVRAFAFLRKSWQRVALASNVASLWKLASRAAEGFSQESPDALVAERLGVSEVR